MRSKSDREAYAYAAAEHMQAAERKMVYAQLDELRSLKDRLDERQAARAELNTVPEYHKTLRALAHPALPLTTVSVSTVVAVTVVFVAPWAAILPVTIAFAALCLVALLVYASAAIYLHVYEQKNLHQNTELDIEIDLVEAEIARIEENLPSVANVNDRMAANAAVSGASLGFFTPETDVPPFVASAEVAAKVPPALAAPVAA